MAGRVEEDESSDQLLGERGGGDIGKAKERRSNEAGEDGLSELRSLEEQETS